VNFSEWPPVRSDYLQSEKTDSLSLKIWIFTGDCSRCRRRPLRAAATAAAGKTGFSEPQNLSIHSCPPTGYYKNDLWEPVAVWRGKFWGSAEEEAPPLYYEMKWSNAWIYVCNLKMFLPLNEGLKRDFTSQWGLEKMFCLLMRAWKDVLPLRGLEKMFCLLMRAWKDVLPLRGLEHMSCLLEDLKRCFAS